MFGLDWNIVSVAIGVIGIGLAIYFYLRPSQKPRPCYAVHPLRVRIVDKTQKTVPGLTILHHDIPPNARNVTAATLYF